MSFHRIFNRVFITIISFFEFFYKPINILCFKMDNEIKITGCSWYNINTHGNTSR